MLRLEGLNRQRRNCYWTLPSMTSMPKMSRPRASRKRMTEMVVKILFPMTLT